MSTTIHTRKPTGKPPWPIMLLAGSEKAGKSYAAAVASASPVIGRTFWISIGEDDPDELGALPGARFEIVEHDGTYRGILGAIDTAAAQPADGLPNMIVVDSSSRLWDLLVDDEQAKANSRYAAKVRAGKATAAEDDAQITMDLWNHAKSRWGNVMTLLRSHAGPVIITSRFKLVTVIEKGKPTSEKEWKVQAEKSLIFDVGVVVEMPARGEVYLSSVRSLKFAAEPGARVPYADFTVERLWRDLGVTEPGSTTARVHATPIVTNPNSELLAEIGALADKTPGGRKSVAADWAETHEGEHLRDATDLGGLELLRDGLRASAS